MVTINEVACPLKKILVMLDMAEVTLCFSCPCLCVVMVTMIEVACHAKKILVMLDMAEVTLCFSCPC